MSVLGELSWTNPVLFFSAVKMRGYSNGPLLSPDFFFIMDRLYETLDKRIELWRKALYPPARPGIMHKVLCRQDTAAPHWAKVEHEIMLERELAVYDLASAYSYMHENRLVICTRV
jgi:hypothetical protein